MPAIPSILCAVVFSVAAQYFVKKGINMLPALNDSSGLHVIYFKIFMSQYVIVGIAMYFVSVLSWLYALTKVELSFATPFLALTYVLMVVVSWLFLGESITWVRWIGLLVVIIGIMIVSFS